MNKILLHVAHLDINEESGVGRVAWHWRDAILKRGFEYVHIGTKDVGTLRHPSLFPLKAFHKYKMLSKQPVVILAHEPVAGVFVTEDVPLILFSHGVEQRAWEIEKHWRKSTIRLRTILLYPLWRLRLSNKGLRRAGKLMLINSEDSAFVQSRFNRKQSDLFLFKNGVYSLPLPDKRNSAKPPVALFLGTWIERKGIHTLVTAAKLLHVQGIKLQWLLAGTRTSAELVLRDWPNELHNFLEIIPEFTRSDEKDILARVNIMVLPSYFEGQSLALLQAMEAAVCCIASDCCGQRDIIKNGVNGYLHPVGDADSLARRLAWAVNNPDESGAIGLAARQSVKNRLWSQVSEEIADFIDIEYKSISSNVKNSTNTK